MSQPEERPVAFAANDRQRGAEPVGDPDAPKARAPREHLEPAEETLAADEAPTPAWLPAVGLGLGLIALLGYLLVPAPPAHTEVVAAATGASSAELAPAAAAATGPRPSAGDPRRARSPRPSSAPEAATGPRPRRRAAQPPGPPAIP